MRRLREIAVVVSTVGGTIACGAVIGLAIAWIIFGPYVGGWD